MGFAWHNFFSSMKKLLLSAALVALSLFNANAQADPNNFCYYGAEYSASFDAPDLGIYSISWQSLNSKGWGADFSIGANYGIVDSDYAGMYFNFGPAYGYAISEKVLVSASMCFSGAYVGQGSVSDSRGNKKENDSKFFAGAALRPRVVFKLGKVLPHAGLMFQYSGATDDVSVGFVAGIGFNI